MNLLTSLLAIFGMSMFIYHGDSFAGQTRGMFYTNPSCSNCPIAKAALNNNCIKYKTVTVYPGNKYGITAVPTYKVNGQTFVGSSEISSYASQHNQCSRS